jgi:hypothetical protein
VNEKRRYATIAAVVGISASRQVLDDEKSFMEIMLGCRTNLEPLFSKIRLVGVGRAELTDFFYQMPTPLEQDEECPIDDDEEDDLPPLLLGDDRQDPIIMAEFRILYDDIESSVHTMQLIGQKVHDCPLWRPSLRLTKWPSTATR